MPDAQPQQCPFCQAGPKYITKAPFTHGPFKCGYDTLMVAERPEACLLREALQSLVDAQNGPPFSWGHHKEFWEQAMQQARHALELSDAPIPPRKEPTNE